MTAGAALVRLTHVSKAYRGHIAVDDVSLEVAKGEIFCLLGASGCGKTTLLRLIAGFEDADAGSILIAGTDMTGVPPYRRPVNLMFQSYALFPHMTVAANVAFGLQQERLPRSEITLRVGAMLELVHLSEFARRKPHQLSGGQRQRVALARALVKRPTLLLLDEPLAALDRKLRQATQFELVKLQRELGVTFVIVTHDQEEAMTLANRIGVMQAGRIVQVGSPQTIYEQPVNRFVADFVGTANLFAGRIVDTDSDRALLDCADLGITIELRQTCKLARGETATLMLRPEQITLAAPASAAAPNTVSGILAATAYVGDAWIHEVALASGCLVKVTMPNAQRRDPGIAIPGSAVALSWDPGSGVLVDA